MQVFKCFPKDKPQCDKAECRSAAAGSCQEPLRGRLTGTVCGRHGCADHLTIGTDGLARCVPHAKIAAKRAA